VSAEPVAGRPLPRGGRSALDPQAGAFLSYIAGLEPPPLSSLTLAEVRCLVRGWRQFMAPAPPVERQEDRVIPGPGGGLPVRLYHPAPAAEGPLPVFVYLHGGGWTTGDLEMGDPLCRTVAVEAGVGVVSVDYRLAPESPFPAAVEDAHAALAWVHSHAGDLGFRPDRMAVGGDSAGGNLAAAAALVARDRGGPELAFQVLLYPACDAAMDTASYRENTEGLLLDAEWMRWFWRHYLNGRDGGHPYASPLRAPDLTGLPPAFIASVGFDPLRDEATAYATRLAGAGVPVELHHLPGQIHGVAWLSGVIDAGRALISRSAAALRTALAGA
jgi:acetyl esterase